MKKIIVFLLLSLLVYAQDEKNDNTGVELPEFVITGQNINTLQQTKKPAAEMVPVISQEFLRPRISPEVPEIMELRGPDNSNLNLRDSVLVKTGRIRALVGINTIPLTDVYISNPFETGILTGTLKGENIRPYVDNAERYFFNAGLGYSIFSGYESSFLPGAQYNVKADFDSKSYKLFAGNFPAFKRNLYQGTVGASVKSLYSNKLMMGLSADFHSTSMTDENYSEALFVLEGFAESVFDNTNVGANVRYLNPTFKDSSGSLNPSGYFQIRPYAGMEFSRILKASVGLNYSKAGDSYFTGLYGSIGFRINEAVSLYGEYSPSGEYITSSGFLNQNMYFNPQDNPAAYVKKSQDLKGLVKYEYGKYFEINGGLQYKAYKDLPYYSEMDVMGTFSIEKTKSHSFTWFANFLFKKGPFGYFYGSVEAGSVKNSENQVVPYFPSLISSLTYGYDLPIDVNIEGNLLYRSGAYTDIENTDKLPAYINLSVNLSYSFAENFKFLAAINNILNKKNYIWNNYREIPVDLLAGISYSW